MIGADDFYDIFFLSDGYGQNGVKLNRAFDRSVAEGLEVIVIDIQVLSAGKRIIVKIIRAVVIIRRNSRHVLDKHTLITVGNSRSAGNDNIALFVDFRVGNRQIRIIITLIGKLIGVAVGIQPRVEYVGRLKIRYYSAVRNRHIIAVDAILDIFARIIDRSAFSKRVSRGHKILFHIVIFGKIDKQYVADGGKLIGLFAAERSFRIAA